MLAPRTRPRPLGIFAGTTSRPAAPRRLSVARFLRGPEASVHRFSEGVAVIYHAGDSSSRSHCSRPDSWSGSHPAFSSPCGSEAAHFHGERCAIAVVPVVVLLQFVSNAYPLPVHEDRHQGAPTPARPRRGSFLLGAAQSRMSSKY